MSDIADKIYAATGLTLGAEEAAKIGQMIQVENEKLRAKQADRIAKLEAALLSAKQHFVADELLKAFIEICAALAGGKKDE
jgi:hypothetical protein